MTEWPELVRFGKFTGQLVGSRSICPEFAIRSDWDYVVRVDNWDADIKELESQGFKEEFQRGYEIGTVSYRRESTNLIVASNDKTIANWLTANKLAKKLHLCKREDRVLVFKAITGRDF